MPLTRADRAMMAVAICTLPTAANGRAAPIRVGAARVDMTPVRGDLPYAPSETPSPNLAAGERPFVGIHDPVFARAIVIADGPRRIALVELDVTAVPEAARIVTDVARAIGTAPGDVLVAATHTHNVPLFSYAGNQPNPRERREIARIDEAAVGSARGALASLQPAEIAFGRGETWVNVNNGEQAGLQNGHDAHGPSDKTVAVIRFFRTDGRPIATIVNYASHAEVMFRSVTRDGGYEITGDLPGAVSRMLETAPGGSPVVLYTAGAEADQLTLYRAREASGRLPASDAGAAGWVLLEVQARRLAEAVLAVDSAMPRPAPLLRIAVATGAATCRGQRISIDPKTDAVTANPEPDVAIPLSVIRLNGIVVGGVGGDVATEIGEQFKRTSPTTEAMMITMTGPSVGYIFADASYARPGHGLTKSPLAPGCAEPAIVDGLVSLAIKAR